MKRIVLESPGHFNIRDIPLPEPESGDALVKIRKVGVCGSDIHLYRRGSIGNIKITDPFVIGSNPDDRVLFSAGSARRKGLTIRFVRRSLNTLGPCIRMTREGCLKPENLVTHTFSAARIKQAFEMVDHYAHNVLKALIDLENWV